MEYVFYIVIVTAFVYVTTGVVQSTLFSTTPIKREQLPAVVEKEFQQLFPEFVAQTITLQKARQRYELSGKSGGRPGQLVFDLTPDSELSVVEFSQGLRDKNFVKHRTISHSQVPSKIANTLQRYLADDQPLMKTGTSQTGMIGNAAIYRIKFDSPRFHYQFDIAEDGELVRFSKREVA